jgi:hypothetical protein
MRKWKKYRQKEKKKHGDNNDEITNGQIEVTNPNKMSWMI